ncbi:MAG TPA: hypothetical protein VEW48_02905 [Thermoanaerobaculia bacterium]|nr:hypothetical protein [Thermoanaerobaculia bacterium]
MAHALRSLVIWFLALWNNLNLKQVGARTGIDQKEVSRILGREEIKDEDYEALLSAVTRRPAEVEIVTGCLEDLEDLDEAGDLTAEEQVEVERGIREEKRLLRSVFIEAARRSRALPALDVYPRPEEVEAARWHAEVLWSLMKDMTEDQQLAVVWAVRACRSWALMERVCEESVNQASGNLERAAFLARLAREIAERVQGPEGWCRCVVGYAAAHAPNVLRVAGELEAARVELEAAKQLWSSGSDPDRVLDPGRLLDLEASLCRDERQFERALALLDEAFPVSHSPGRILVNKGSTLEVMGETRRAIETFLQAELYVDRAAEPRLWYKMISNLAVHFVDTGRYAEAAGLVEQARTLADELGDAIDASRLTWVEGRIAAGQGRREEALRLLDQARREFAARRLWYDVALARQEVAALLLDEGRTAEVKPLAAELVEIFESKGVHLEALAALRLFAQAAEREQATAELARSVLRFLLRARHDQSLRYTGSGTLEAAAVGVENAACVGDGLRGHGAAAGVHPAAGIRRSGREQGDQRGGEGDGKEDRAHRVVSCAAPASGLRGPRGPRLPGMVRQSSAKNPTSCQVDKRLSLRQRLARLARALSGMSQKVFGESTRVDPKMLALYEVGDRDPSPETVQRLTGGVGLTVPAAEEVLRFADTLRRPRRRTGLGASDLFPQLEALGTRFLERLLRLPAPDPVPRAEDRLGIEELWAQLKDLPEDQQVAVVRVGREFQNWALAERCCAESVSQASCQIERAASLARLAREIADCVPGLEGWRLRLTGYVAAHAPNVARVAGDLERARADFEKAKQIWVAGSDPGGLLDEGVLLDLEASLCRDERNFGKALTLLDEAFLVGRCKGRILVNKGSILEIMGDSERAVETFLEAMSLVDRAAEPRLWYKLRANLGVSYTHVGRFAEAVDLVRQARPVAVELEDEIDLVRLTWLEGRILAGLGRSADARTLLEQARQEFAAREMWYDVALADLEIAALLLAENRTAEVKEMSRKLVEAFESRGVHREALTALQLFHKAAEREEATAELARRVLRYLFRARYDEELRFEAGK